MRKELTILRMRNFSLKECWTIVYGVGKGPLISIILAELIGLYLPPDLTNGLCS